MDFINIFYTGIKLNVLCLQFIIGQDGACGLTYEHSPSEGQPIAVMTDYLVEYM